MKIGEEYKTNDGSILKIVDYKSSLEVLIEFQDDYSHTKWVQAHQIRSGSIKNPYSISVRGVGRIGNIEKPTKHPLYSRWKSMIDRCYHFKDKNYAFYGAKGVAVSDSWKTFSNYVADVEKMENFDKLINDPHNWHLDKDKNGVMVYSVENCSILSAKENSSLANSVKILQITKSGGFVSEFDSIAMASLITGINYTGIQKVLSGERKTAGKYMWKYKEEL